MGIRRDEVTARNFFHTMYEKPLLFFIFVFFLHFLRKLLCQSTHDHKKYSLILIFPRKTDDKPLCCCETCPNKVACVKTSNEEYTDIGTLKSFSSNGSIMEEIKEKLKPFIKENLKCL